MENGNSHGIIEEPKNETYFSTLYEKEYSTLKLHDFTRLSFKVSKKDLTDTIIQSLSIIQNILPKTKKMLENYKGNELVEDTMLNINIVMSKYSTMFQLISNGLGEKSNRESPISRRKEEEEREREIQERVENAAELINKEIEDHGLGIGISILTGEKRDLYIRNNSINEYELNEDPIIMGASPQKSKSSTLSIQYLEGDSAEMEEMKTQANILQINSQRVAIETQLENINAYSEAIQNEDIIGNKSSANSLISTQEVKGENLEVNSGGNIMENGNAGDIPNMKEINSKENNGNSTLTKDTICIPATYIILTAINKVFFKLLLSFPRQDKTKIVEKDLQMLQNNIKNLYMGIMLLITAIDATEEEIFYYPLTHPTWQKMKKYIEIDTMNNEKFKKEYIAFEKHLLISEASCSKALKYPKTGEFKVFMKTGMYMAYYLIRSKLGIRAGEKFLSNPEFRVAKQFWNMFDNRYISIFMNRLLPSTKIHKKLFLPKLLPQLTTEQLCNDNAKAQQEYELEESKRQEIIRNSEENLALESVESPPPPSLTPSQALNINKDLILNKKKFDVSRHVQVRLITNHNFKLNTKNNTIRPPTKGPIPNEVLIHIHGGGFIAMSSRSHQCYTRKFAKVTGMVVFSVDYRLAPNPPFPASLDDVWQAYYWIITQALPQMGIPIKTILIAGDSAGGNLALALTLRAIHAKVRIPDGLIIAYPALNLNIKRFTPSSLLALDDVVLRHTFLQFALDSYVGDADPSSNPYVSPILISDKDLQQFPPIRLMVAGKCPLRDESYNFLRRLVEISHDVKLKEYRMFPHGIWSLSAPFGLKPCAYAIVQACDWMKELIRISDAKQQ